MVLLFLCRELSTNIDLIDRLILYLTQVLTRGNTSLFLVGMAPFSWDALVPGRTTVFVMEGGIPYKCVIMAVLEETMKIHYVGFNKRHDEWIPVESNRIIDSDDVDEDELVVVGATQPESVAGSSSNGTGDELVVDGLHVEAAASERNSVKRRLDESSDGGLAVDGGAAKRPSIQLDTDPLITSDAISAAVDGSTSGVEVVRVGPENSLPQCRFCGLKILGKIIVCSGCKLSFHPDTMCLGVKSEVVKVLFANEDGALSYNCCHCRLNGNGGDSRKEALSQLLCSVGEIAREVRELKNARQLNVGTSGYGRGPIPSVSTGAESGNYSVTRVEVLEHLRELKEREKRANSIVLRGFGNLSLDEVRAKFSRICVTLRLEPIHLTGIVRINNTGLYRAVIVDAEIRRALLLKAQELRNSEEFSRVYVNRDLTFQQRQELFNRRSAHQAEVEQAQNPNSVGTSVVERRFQLNDQRRFDRQRGITSDRQNGGQARGGGPFRGRGRGVGNGGALPARGSYFGGRGRGGSSGASSFTGSSGDSNRTGSGRDQDRAAYGTDCPSTGLSVQSYAGMVQSNSGTSSDSSVSVVGSHPARRNSIGNIPHIRRNF